MKKLSIVMVLSISCIIGFAQENEFTRKGLVLGGSIGGGIHMFNDVTYGRFSAPNLKIGAMLNPKLALMLYAPGGTYTRLGEERAFEGFIPTAQYWLSNRLYLNGGIGVGVETTPFYKVDPNTGPPKFNLGLGSAISVGYELIHWSKNKTVDTQLRFFYGQIELENGLNTNNLAIDLLIGINLY